jgi:hypothetical protein
MQFAINDKLSRNENNLQDVSIMLGARRLEILLILYKHVKTHNNSELIPFLNVIQKFNGRKSRKTYIKYLKAVYAFKISLIVIEGKFSKKIVHYASCSQKKA